jgi:hypothetical protein
MRAAVHTSVDREINQNMVEALAEVCLLNWQIAAQPVAIRVPFAGRLVPMPICRRIVIAASGGCKRSERPVASSHIVHVMPTTSKHRMDEQRSTQQATKNSTHHVFNRISAGEPSG